MKKLSNHHSVSILDIVSDVPMMFPFLKRKFIHRLVYNIVFLSPLLQWNGACVQTACKYKQMTITTTDIFPDSIIGLEKKKLIHIKSYTEYSERIVNKTSIWKFETNVKKKT